jgi:hypothetical protein
MAASRAAQLGAHATEAAVADHDGRDTVPARQCQVRIPEQLGIVVRVEVDEARRHDLSAGVEDARGVRAAQPADPGDTAARDADVGAIAL